MKIFISNLFLSYLVPAFRSCWKMTTLRRVAGTNKVDEVVQVRVQAEEQRAWVYTFWRNVEQRASKETEGTARDDRRKNPGEVIGLYRHQAKRMFPKRGSKF